MSAWKQFERTCANLFGGARFWANSGAKLDFESPQVVGQCKLVKNLSLEQLTQLAEMVAVQAKHTNKLGVVCAKVRRGCGKESPTLIVMTADTFTDWYDMRLRNNGASNGG